MKAPTQPRQHYRRPLWQWFVRMAVAGLAATAGRWHDPRHGVLAWIAIEILLGGLVSYFVWRSGTYATPAGIRCVPISGATTSYKWAEIANFEVERQRNWWIIAAVFVNGDRLELPSARGWTSQKGSLERACSGLRAARQMYAGDAASAAS